MSTGKGSLEKRDQEGFTWKLVVCSGYNKSGKKIRQTKTIHVEGRTIDSRKKAAERELSLFLAETEKTDYIEPSKYRIEDFVNKWLEEYAEKNLEKKTYLRYKELLQGRFCEALGHKKLQELKPMHLLEFYDNLQKNGIRKDMKYIAKIDLKELIESQGIELKHLANKANISERTLSGILSGTSTIAAHKISTALDIKLDKIFILISDPKPLSNKTIQHYHKAISSMLNDAVQWQLITSNPATRVQPPKAVKKEIPCFNEDHASILLGAIEKEPLKFRTLIHLALSTGARRGEIVGLEWKDVDIDKNTIRISQSAQYLSGLGVTLKQPKNKSSNRLISVPPSTMALLKQYKAVQSVERLKVGDQWIKDNDFVFTAWNGQIMHPDTITGWFPEFIKKHNKSVKQDESIPEDQKNQYFLPLTNFHSLRHSAATLLINQGLNVRALSNRLGHANTSTTLNIYSHALQSADVAAADMMENIITNKKGSSVHKKQA